MWTLIGLVNTELIWLQFVCFFTYLTYTDVTIYYIPVIHLFHFQRYFTYPLSQFERVDVPHCALEIKMSQLKIELELRGQVFSFLLQLDEFFLEQYNLHIHEFSSRELADLRNDSECQTNTDYESFPWKATPLTLTKEVRKCETTYYSIRLQNNWVWTTNIHVYH